MSEKTAKVIDFEAFRSARRIQAPASATQPAPAHAAASPAFVWPMYWVYFPNIYVSSGY
jgi:hypothetical protein